jgi:hypothetical protein
VRVVVLLATGTIEVVPPSQAGTPSERWVAGQQSVAQAAAGEDAGRPCSWHQAESSLQDGRARSWVVHLFRRREAAVIFTARRVRGSFSNRSTA